MLARLVYVPLARSAVAPLARSRERALRIKMESQPVHPYAAQCDPTSQCDEPVRPDEHRLHIAMAQPAACVVVNLGALKFEPASGAHQQLTTAIRYGNVQRRSVMRARVQAHQCTQRHWRTVVAALSNPFAASHLHRSYGQ